MVSKVAAVEFRGDVRGSFERALELIGGIEDLDDLERPVVIKPGIYDHKAKNHPTVGVVDAIIKSFGEAPRILLAESDNHMGRGLERLRLWEEVFTERVLPFNLSEDTNTKEAKVVDEEVGLSHALFEPSVFVSVHVLRVNPRGSVLKNLLGLIPDIKKERFHGRLEAALLDVCEAIGGIDLAVLDGAYTYYGKREEGRYKRVRSDILLVGRDAVAVETVGASLVGLDADEVPVIREAIKRGLGEGSINEIEVVGYSLESLRKKFSSISGVEEIF